MASCHQAKRRCHKLGRDGAATPALRSAAPPGQASEDAQLYESLLPGAPGLAQDADAPTPGAEKATPDAVRELAARAQQRHAVDGAMRFAKRRAHMSGYRADDDAFGYLPRAPSMQGR